ncbi:hypothetical protein PUN28_005263 [Cardiocondyla obscurior]|uniref:Uncharacterized protein n=1 Tax=Cardiocondyla obscurior TaxID=286306 RepID=A0AAW2GJL1_9HYME
MRVPRHARGERENLRRMNDALQRPRCEWPAISYLIFFFFFSVITAQLRINEITFTRARARGRRSDLRDQNINSVALIPSPARATILARRLTSLYEALRVLRRASSVIRRRIQITTLVHLLTLRPYAMQSQ